MQPCSGPQTEPMRLQRPYREQGLSSYTERRGGHSRFLLTRYFALPLAARRNCRPLGDARCNDHSDAGAHAWHAHFPSSATRADPIRAAAFPLDTIPLKYSRSLGLSPITYFFDIIFPQPKYGHFHINRINFNYTKYVNIIYPTFLDGYSTSDNLYLFGNCIPL